MKKIKKFLTSSLLALSLVSKTYKNPIYNLNKNIKPQSNGIIYCIYDKKNRTHCLSDDLFFFKEYYLEITTSKKLTLEKIEYLNKNHEVIYTLDTKQKNIHSSKNLLKLYIYNPLLDFNTYDNSAYYMFFYLKDDKNNIKIIPVSFKDRYENFSAFLPEGTIDNSNNYPYLYPIKEEIVVKIYYGLFDKTVFKYSNGQIDKNKNFVSIGLHEPAVIKDKIQNISKFTFKYYPIYSPFSILNKEIELYLTQGNDLIFIKKLYYISAPNGKDVFLPQFTYTNNTWNNTYQYHKSIKINIPIKKITQNNSLIPDKTYNIRLKTRFGSNYINPEVEIPIQFVKPNYENKLFLYLNKKQIKTIVRNINNQKKVFYDIEYSFKIKNKSKYAIGENLYKNLEDIKKDFYVQIDLNCSNDEQRQIILPIRRILKSGRSANFYFKITTDPNKKDKANTDSLDNPIYYFDHEKPVNCNINYAIFEAGNPISVSIDNRR